MNKNSFLLGILIALFGIFMIISPASMVILTAILLGVAAIADGCFILASFRSLLDDSRFRTMAVVRGVLSILIGILAIALPLVFAKVMWAAMIYMLGAYLVVSSGLEIIAVVQLKKNGAAIKPFVIEIVSSLLIAAVLFIIPANTIGSLIIRICGIVVVICGAAYSFYIWKTRDLVINAEVYDDDSPSSDSKQK